MYHRGPATAEPLRLEGVLELPLDDPPDALALERQPIVHGRLGAAGGIRRQLALEHEVDRAMPGGRDAHRESAAVRLDLHRIDQRRAGEDACIEGEVAGGEPDDTEDRPQGLVAAGRVGREQRALADVEQQHERRDDCPRQRPGARHQPRRRERRGGDDDGTRGRREDPRAERVEHEQRGQVRAGGARPAACRRPHAGSGGHGSGALFST